MENPLRVFQEFFSTFYVLIHHFCAFSLFLPVVCSCYTLYLIYSLGAMLGASVVVVQQQAARGIGWLVAFGLGSGDTLTSREWQQPKGKTDTLGLAGNGGQPT